jgi:hypothetical protein
VTLSEATRAAGRHDPALRRRGARKQREKGCHLYVSAEQLEQAGFDPNDPPPFYRIWPSSRGGLFVRLYKEA